MSLRFRGLVDGNYVIRRTDEEIGASVNIELRRLVYEIERRAAQTGTDVRASQSSPHTERVLDSIQPDELDKLLSHFKSLR